MKLLRQIANLFKQLKAVAAAITTVGIIAGATLWITRTSNNNQADQSANFDRMFDSIAAVKQLAEYNNIEIGFLAQRQEDFHDTLESFENEHKSQSKQIESLAWGLKNIERFTPDQFEDVLDEMLKKNDRIGPMPIIMRGGDLIPYEWRTIPETELIGAK